MKSVAEILEGCKSAVVIEDPKEIHDLLGQRAEEQKSQRTSSVIHKDSDQICIHKQQRSSLAIEEGAPVVPDAEGIVALAKERRLFGGEELADRTVPYWASDERVDGDGDIIRQSWHFDEFKTNSPMPFSHNWHSPPVGKVIDWKITDRTTDTFSGKALWLLGVFAKAEDWEFADTVFRLVKSGMLVGGSVGFWASRVVRVEDDTERAELGLGRFGVVFEENHLLEFSPTTIPANPGVYHLLAKNKANLKPIDVHVLRELKRQEIVREGGKQLERWNRSECLLLQVAKTFWPEERYVHHKDIDVPLFLDEEILGRVKEEVENQRFDDLQSSINTLSLLVDDLKSGVETNLSDIRDHLEALVSIRNLDPQSENEGESEIFTDLQRAVETIVG